MRVVIKRALKKESSQNTYKVTEQALHKTLHFTGVIQPLNESTLSSPIQAVVETMNFHYGQLVKKGDLILVLRSNELQKQYNAALTEYLKAKDSYSVAKTKFVGTQSLWDSGLISKNNYVNEKSALDIERMTLMQATRKFTEMLDKTDEHNIQNLAELNLADFYKVKQVLKSDHNLIHLKAPNDGVMLYPPKSSDDKGAKITVGSTVKAGQVISLIGDMQGIKVEIDIAETDIDKVHTGMDAIISGVAFGKHQLKGKLISVNAQASNMNHGGLPTFTALVEVQALSQEQQTWIKVGMSAAIELAVASEHQLFIPIGAIKREKGQNTVSIQLAKGIEKRIVTTGTVQADSVVIESGLKVGDLVVYE